MSLSIEAVVGLMGLLLMCIPLVLTGFKHVARRRNASKPDSSGPISAQDRHDPTTSLPKLAKPRHSTSDTSALEAGVLCMVVST